jgi:hypothetical protein
MLDDIPKTPEGLPETGKRACDLREPPIGIEPMTYSLRDKAERFAGGVHRL